MYITSLSVDGYEYFLTISFSPSLLYTFKPRNLTTLNMAFLLYYMVIKQAFLYETKGIYLQTRPKLRNSFVSKKNKYAEFRSTIVANTYMFNKEMCHIQLHTYTLVVW